VLKVGVMSLNAEALPVFQTPRNFIIRRPNVHKEIKYSRGTRRVFELDWKINSRGIDTEIGKDFLPRSRRRATGERLHGNERTIIFI
jgi:hypothetical protein